jgi:hypothetical protein
MLRELIKAANQIGKVSAGERMRLMSGGARTFRVMRLETGVRYGKGKDG